jgi:hypothetical protein
VKEEPEIIDSDILMEHNPMNPELDQNDTNINDSEIGTEIE